MKQIFIAFLLFFSTYCSADECSLMSKQFFLEEMDGIVGKNAPPVLERPKHIKKLLGIITSKYPDTDSMTCLTQGLEAAKKQKTLAMKEAKSIA
jgi:hypothetical protein